MSVFNESSTFIAMRGNTAAVSGYDYAMMQYSCDIEVGDKSRMA